MALLSKIVKKVVGSESRKVSNVKAAEKKPVSKSTIGDMGGLETKGDLKAMRENTRTNTASGTKRFNSGQMGWGSEVSSTKTTRPTKTSKEDGLSKTTTKDNKKTLTKNIERYQKAKSFDEVSGPMETAKGKKDTPVAKSKGQAKVASSKAKESTQASIKQRKNNDF